MNARTLEIVETLLDLHEDLNSKIPILHKQFPEYSEEQIRQMAEADPTCHKKALFITWLLRLRRRNAWDGNPEPVRSLLAHFARIKDANFRGYLGPRDINQMRSIDDLQQHLGMNVNAGSVAEREKTGIFVFNRKDDLTLIQATTPEALVKLGVGNSTPDKPQTSWCTTDLSRAKMYLQMAPVFVINKNDEPYAQVTFRHGRGCATNTQNFELSSTVAAEIAPLFNLTLTGGMKERDYDVETGVERLLKAIHDLYGPAGVPADVPADRPADGPVGFEDYLRDIGAV